MAPPIDPRIQAGAAVAGSVLSTGLAGPWGAVAGQVLATGLAFWSDYSQKMADGTLTEQDVREAAAITGDDLDILRAEVEAREAAGR